MDTIIVYLDNMFTSLPKTPELERLKQELLLGMEEKYVELKGEGKTENEAIGIVISEFGNIEELTAELDIHAEQTEDIPVLTEEDVNDYTKARRHSGLEIGLGVILCAGGIALLLVFDTLFENKTIANSSVELGTLLGLVGMFVLIAAAVGLFIHSGMNMSRFRGLEQGFQLPYTLKSELQHRRALFVTNYRFSIILGISLCVLSPILVIIASYINEDYSPYGAAALLLMVAFGVFLFIYSGNVHGAYTRLLEEPYIAVERTEEGRVLEAAGAVIWPIASIVFLISGFVYQRWDINWVVFPIAGILQGMSSSMYQTWKR